MKKFIVAISAFLYLSTSLGATVHLHYCMGKLVNWRLGHEKISTCNYCGMQMQHQSMDEGCCKDEFKQIKNDKDQKLSGGFFKSIKLAPGIVPVSFTISSITISPLVSGRSGEIVAYLRSPDTDLHIIHCVFRI